MADITIPCSWGDLPTYVAKPQTAGPWPGVVVIHDAGGMKPDLRNQAEWLASEGFLGAMIGISYHEPSARDAQRRIVSFFRTHLAAP